MSDYLGVAKRKNGHKMDCRCHICENIKKKHERGGYEEDRHKKMLKLKGVPTKQNGHKHDCSCLFCKNMKNKHTRKAIKTKNPKKNKKSRKTKRRKIIKK